MWALLPACAVMIVLVLFSSVDHVAPSGEKAIKFSASAARHGAEVDVGAVRFLKGTIFPGPDSHENRF